MGAPSSTRLTHNSIPTAAIRTMEKFQSSLRLRSPKSQQLVGVEFTTPRAAIQTIIDSNRLIPKVISAVRPEVGSIQLR